MEKNTLLISDLGSERSRDRHQYNRDGDYRMKYKIALYKSEEGYSVSCPGLPGCWSQEATEEEALENIQDAIKEYLEAVDLLIQDAEVREVEVTV